MGLVLFPGDGDNNSPDVSWSYTGFHAFRRRLAQSEGFDLSEMGGFDGDRPWSQVTTVLEPFLNHPDDSGDLSPADCAVILPRLETITDQWEQDGDDVLLRKHIEDARQLAVILRICLEKRVPLLFI
ncbi:hypothetical protein [Micromonospora auratinigra]|uniref:Uncharacterized protein n=1 Tax=Micromonospora auratinigra TaxID=261654 RepID=A0A1A8Z4Z2_9ACTN|nr:hypothetical protein [Micromonospora auratinigra]SBT38849.1 hypothetical protein GA0070611_0697 [Micromonospora auratinigra]